MTANRLFRAIALLWIVGSLGVVAQEPAVAGDLYLIILQPDQRDRAPFDPATLGGHLEHRNGSRLAVRLTSQAAAEAARDPRVRTLQRVTLGIPGRRDAPAVEEMAQWIPNGSDALSSGIYAYDGSGNTQSIGPNSRGVKDEFTYDRFARLATAKVHSGTNARTQNYVYDNAGNLTRVVNVGGVILDLPVNAATNRLSNAIATYDTVGHLTHTPLANYTYDQTGMMSQTGALTYVYTAADERILVVPTVGSDTWRWTLRDLQGRKVREYESVRGEDFLWLEDDYYDGQRLIASERETAEGGRRHYHPDHLGTPRLITNAGGQQISTHDYLPFGVEITSIHQEAARGYLREQTAQFTGHERDVTPGLSEHTAYLDYMHARYYNPNWGRFLTVDPGRDWDASQPQSWNLYSYVRHDPIGNIDPDGREQQATLSQWRWTPQASLSAVSIGDRERNHELLAAYTQTETKFSVGFMSLTANAGTGQLTWRLNLSWGDVGFKAWDQTNVREGPDAGQRGALGYTVTNGDEKKTTGDPEPAATPTVTGFEIHKTAGKTGFRFGIGILTQIIAVDWAKLKKESDREKEREKAEREKKRKKTQEEEETAKKPGK